MEPKIFVTRSSIPDEALQWLHASCDVRLWEEDTPVPREVLERQVGDAEGLLCTITEPVDDALLSLAPRLKAISTISVGYNHVDVDAATRRNIAVTNTPGVLTETTADLTFALLLAAARRLIEASDNLRQGKWKTWSLMELAGQDVYGASLGIVGMGRIGEAVARRAQGFNMTVQYYNRSRKPESETQFGAKYCDLETLLRTSDFVVVLTPYTQETANLIGAKELRWMKPTSILINTARGGIVDEDALFEALAEGRIWAAGLDVFESEPLPATHPLLTLPNVVALPHIGSSSIPTRTKMAVMAAKQLVDVLHGGKPEQTVNPEVFTG